MKLTNTIRDAFVRSAMSDVPSVDYAEKIRAATRNAVLNTLPKPVLAIYKDEKTRPYLKQRGVSLVRSCSTMVPWPDDWEKETSIRLSIGAKDREEIDQLGASMKAQDEGRLELERKLKACAYSVTTRKALVAMLPEFEKYLPADEPAAARTLPVVANVVSDFVKAGWPKGTKA